MNAGESRMITLENFDKTKTEKTEMILEKIKESAESGQFTAYFDDMHLSFTEASHLRALGYEVIIEYGQKRRGRTIYCTSEITIKW